MAGHEQLVSPSAGATIAYDPATGRELWRVKSGGMNAAARPLFGHGLVFATTATGGWQLFAVRPDGSGDTSDTHLAWKSGKTIPTRSSPLLIGDLIFMVSDAGVASCVDAKTGDQIWQKRLPGEYTASPIFANGRIYFFNEKGDAPVLEPGRKFKQLAVNELDEGCMASPAVVGNAMFVAHQDPSLPHRTVVRGDPNRSRCRSAARFVPEAPLGPVVLLSEPVRGSRFSLPAAAASQRRIKGGSGLFVSMGSISLRSECMAAVMRRTRVLMAIAVLLAGSSADAGSNPASGNSTGGI